MSKVEIPAVHKTKLRELLEKLELWEPLQSSEIKCAICKSVISLENIGLLVPSGDEILICCSKTECMFKAEELRRVSNEN